MKNTFLVEVLGWLSPGELVEAAAFIKSEFHNKDKHRAELLRLFDYMKRYHPDFPETEIDKKKVYQFVFPNESKVASKLEKLSSKLYTLIKSYILWKRYQQPKHDFFRAMEWAQFLASVNASGKFETALEKIENDFLENVPLSITIIERRFQYESVRQVWLALMNKGREDINLNRSVQSLGMLFETYRLEYQNQFLFQSGFSNINLSNETKLIFDTKIQIDHYQDNPLLRILNIINQISFQPVPPIDLVRRLHEEIEGSNQLLEVEELKNLYTYLRNLYSNLINYGHEQFYQTLFNLLKDNLEKGYLYKNDSLHTSTLANITKMAIRSGQVDWAITCIEQHKHCMVGDIDTDDYYRISMAACFFEKKEFDKVLDILAPSSPNIQYHLWARRLEIMCYYELQSELLPYKLEAFKIYIWRASDKFLSQPMIEGNKTFVNTLLQLLSIPLQDAKKRKLLYEKVRKKQRVPESKWLLGKLE